MALSKDGIRLHMGYRDWEELHREADKRGKMSHIKRQQLINLLMDHSKLLRYLDDARVNVTWEKDDG